MTPHQHQRKEFIYFAFLLVLLFGLTLLSQMTIYPLLTSLNIKFPNTYYQPGQIFFLDIKEYQEMAHSFLAQKSFRYEGQLTTMRPPIYPLFLAIIYGFKGNHSHVIAIQQCLGAFCSIFTYLITWKIIQNQKIAFLSALITAVYIPFQMMAFSLLADMLFAFLLMGSILLLCFMFQNRESKMLPVLLGLFMAITTLTRPVTLFLPFVLYLFCLKPKKIFSFHLIHLCTLSFLICLSPWIIRNYAVTGRIIMVASAGAYNLWQGSFYSSVVYAESAGEYDPEFKQNKNRLSGNDYYIDYQAEPRFLKAALKRIFDDPLAYTRFCIERLLRVYTAFPGTRDWVIEKRWKPYILLSIIQVSLWLLAGIGLYKIKTTDYFFLFLLLFIYQFSFNAAFNLISRYVLPWLPLTFVFTSIGIHQIALNLFKSKNS